MNWFDHASPESIPQWNIFESEFKAQCPVWFTLQTNQGIYLTGFYSGGGNFRFISRVELQHDGSHNPLTSLIHLTSLRRWSKITGQ